MNHIIWICRRWLEHKLPAQISLEASKWYPSNPVIIAVVAVAAAEWFAVSMKLAFWTAESVFVELASSCQRGDRPRRRSRSRDGFLLWKSEAKVACLEVMEEQHWERLLKFARPECRNKFRMPCVVIVVINIHLLLLLLHRETYPR